jgi:uncharacterized membrane protein YfcA
MLVVAVLAGLLIGLSLGALGGGGSILAVPALVYLLDQSPVAATTGALLVVGISAATGAVAAWRQGQVYVGRGLVFGLVGTVGAAAGATWSVHVDPDLLLACFAALMLVVAVVMLARQRGGARERLSPQIDEPIIQVSPTFFCNCPRALKVLVTALVVGTLTGFLGVGGGFLVVPALVLALALPMPVAVGTSLLVITVNSAAAFAVRLGHGVELDWAVVGLLTAAAVLGSLLGARVAARLDPRTLGLAFSVLLLGVAGYTAWQSLPALLA